MRQPSQNTNIAPAQPSLFIQDLDIKFANQKLLKQVSDQLLQESFLELIVGQVDQPTQIVKIYLITEYGTLICLYFDFKERIVKDVKITTYIKDMVCFKIMKIKANENLQVCMLIEHDCLCQVKFYNGPQGGFQMQDEQQFGGRDSLIQNQNQKVPTIMNEDNSNLAIGLIECQVPNANMMSLNQSGSYIIVANQELIEIFSSSPNPANPQIQLNLERILIVDFVQLPLLIHGIEDLVFDRFERNVFYAVGIKNLNFESSQYENNDHADVIQDNVRIEKFFIESDSFSSKTQAFLQMKQKDEEVLFYNISQNQEKVAVYTNQGNLYTYNITNLDLKFNATINSQDQKARMQTQENLQCFEESKHTTHTKEFNFKDSMHTQELTQNQTLVDRTPNQKQLNNPNRITEEQDEADDIKPLNPIGKLINLGEDIQDLKWILNDTFLVVVTVSNRMIVFDNLLYAFNIISQADQDGPLQKNIKLNLNRQIAKISNEDSRVIIRGFDQPQNTNGLHLINQNQFFAVTTRRSCVKLVYLENFANFDKQVKFDMQFIVKQHLNAQRVNHVHSLITTSINDPETWLSCSLQFINYCLINSEVLSLQQITKVKLFQLYKISHQRPDFDYFNHTIEYYFNKLCLKYLSLKMFEEALYIAFEMDSISLLNYVKVLARKQKNTIVQALIDFQRERSNPGSSSTSLMKSLIQIANFSKKQLKKEDFSNLYKDFDTLLRIDDISDLELSDFNSWEINLDDYQKALDFEFEGKFEEAMKIYEENNLNNDVFRVKSILNELSKEIREGEKHLIFEDIKKFINHS